MKIKEPMYRFGNPDIMEELAKELDVPFNKNMQDWSYEISNPDRIEEYLEYYDNTAIEDKKFILMETIIQATEEQTDSNSRNKYWPAVSDRIKKNFSIHEFTVFYWSCFNTEDLNDCFYLTPEMRKIWFELEDNKKDSEE